MEDLDFNKDTFADILQQDKRYSPRAYTLLVDVIDYLSREGEDFPADAILDEFRERALDLYGPLAYEVLSEWGVHETHDIGEMMANLVETRRARQGEDDSLEDFNGGYDFCEAFLAPYKA